LYLFIFSCFAFLASGLHVFRKFFAQNALKKQEKEFKFDKTTTQKALFSRLGKADVYRRMD
jgi:hypothetical protein